MDDVLNLLRVPRTGNRRFSPERGLLSLLGMPSEGMAHFDGAGGFLAVSPELEALFGVQPGTLHGRRLQDFLLPGRRSSDEDLEAWELLEQRGVHELQIRCPGGKSRHLLLRTSPCLGPEGTRQGTLGVFRDVTDWRRTELDSGRLSVAIEQSFDSIIMVDVQGRILYANPATRELTGYSLESLLGSHIACLGSPEQDRVFYKDLWRRLLAGEVWKGNIQYRRADGGTCEVLSTFSPVRDEEGRVLYAVIDSKDVSREMELEAQLRHSQRMEAIGVLAGGIAHDFNNLLTPLLGYAEMAMMSSSGNEKIERYLQEVMAAGRRAAGLVEQILAFSRRGEQPRRPVPFGAIAKEALKLLRAGIPRTIAIRSRIQPGDTLVWADPGQLHQVVMNLCTNAFQAMREKGGNLEISLDRMELTATVCIQGRQLPPGPYLRLQVSDTGCGMDAQTLKRAFLPFFTTRRPGEGTGLGLSIVHGIVHGMGGAIEVESRQGRGTTFIVLVPALESQVVDAPMAAGPPAPGRGRILVVDDEVAVGELMREILESLGYEAAVFNSSPMALDALSLSGHGFDLVISDMTMPELTGLELLQNLRETGNEIPVILMTGFCQDMDGLGEHADGPAALLHKPVDIRALAGLLAGILPPT
nr:PAS domain S-box protein [uncultured Holophaga sp.]